MLRACARQQLPLAQRAWLRRGLSDTAPIAGGAAEAGQPAARGRKPPGRWSHLVWASLAMVLGFQVAFATRERKRLEAVVEEFETGAIPTSKVAERLKQELGGMDWTQGAVKALADATDADKEALLARRVADAIDHATLLVERPPSPSPKDE